MHETDPKRTRKGTILYSLIAKGYTQVSRMEEPEAYRTSSYSITCTFIRKIVRANCNVSTLATIL